MPSLVRVKKAGKCSIPAGAVDRPVKTRADRAGHDPPGVDDMSDETGTDSVQQDMFTVLHGQPAPVVTRWSYTADDPFAVTLAVRTRHDRWVEWLVARDLVAAALEGPSGLGDVRMGPQTVQGYDIVEIEIRSTDGRAILEVDRDLLRHFVTSTTEIVALGDESGRMDLDGEIARLTQSC